MSKRYNYFDRGKSLVENGYYLLMILSIVFVAIQVIIARNSLDHSAQLELTRHTIEQDNRYRVAIEQKAEELMGMMPYNDSIMADPVEIERLAQIQLDLAIEL